MPSSVAKNDNLFCDKRNTIDHHPWPANLKRCKILTNKLVKQDNHQSLLKPSFQRSIKRPCQIQSKLGRTLIDVFYTIGVTKKSVDNLVINNDLKISMKNVNLLQV